jgi:hypothetical protein
MPSFRLENKQKVTKKLPNNKRVTKSEGKKPTPHPLPPFKIIFYKKGEKKTCPLPPSKVFLKNKTFTKYKSNKK